MNNFDSTTSSTKSSKLLNLAPYLLIPSGCAALIYQVIWVRLLGLSIGSTSAAVSIVLAAFFLGITLGSILSAKVAKSSPIDLKTFAWLELIIAASGLALLPTLLHLDYLMAALGGAGSHLSIKFFISLLLLLVPTACMGATYPVLASALAKKQEELGNALSNLYTLNTSGAVAGAILSGFLFIPTFGLDGSVIVAFTFNLFAGVTALLLFHRIPKQTETDSKAIFTDSTTKDKFDNEHLLIGIILFMTGFIAIASEVAWTKYLSIFVGATLYGFSAILGIFLIGIAAGSWYTKNHVSEKLTSPLTAAWALVVLASTLLIARSGLALLPETLSYIGTLNELKQAAKYLAVLTILLPSTFVFGALFPITLSLYCERTENVNRRIGLGYGINTLGSILGSIAAGFILIPMVGTDKVLTLSVILAIALSFLLLSYVGRGRKIFQATLALLLIATWALPGLDYKHLITSNPYRFDSDATSGKTPSFLYLEEGKAGVISLIKYDDTKAKLQNNGIQESFIPLNNQVNPPFTEVLLGIMPYLLHENPKTAFAVGFGGGNTLQAIAKAPLDKIDVVELEPAVVSAVRAAYPSEIPVLQDPRVNLSFNDARNSLLVENQSYDLIVSQPSHPWLSGAGNLFTKEFFQIASKHLNEGGIFAQWVNLFNMDVTTLKAILKAYYQVFPHGFTLANTDAGDLLIFGSHSPITIDPNRITERMRSPAIRNALAPASISKPEHLLWFFSMSRDEAITISSSVDANTDTRIISEVRLAKLTANPEGDENPYHFLRQNYQFDVLNYLPEDQAGKMIYLAGKYFFRHHSTTRTRAALKTLQTINPALAKRLDADWQKWKQQLRQQSTAAPVDR